MNAFLSSKMACFFSSLTVWRVMYSRSNPRNMWRSRFELAHRHISSRAGSRTSYGIPKGGIKARHSAQYCKLGPTPTL